MFAADQKDPLTALLENCRFQSRVEHLAQLVPPWGGEIADTPPGFYLVLEGRCVLETDITDHVLHLKANDLVIVTRQHVCRLRDSLDTPPPPIRRVLDLQTSSPRFRPADSGRSTSRMAHGVVNFNDDCSRQMFGLLPDLAVVSASDSGHLQMVAQLLKEEISHWSAGSDLFQNCLTRLLIICAMRHGADVPEIEDGPIAALRVPGLSSALGAIHTRPQVGWTVESLAELAGTSRSAFAMKFAESVGHPPLKYLRLVRMQLACQLLGETDIGIKEVARRVGYTTGASFGKAFCSFVGQSPGQFRSSQKRSAKNSCSRRVGT